MFTFYPFLLFYVVTSITIEWNYRTFNNIYLIQRNDQPYINYNYFSKVRTKVQPQDASLLVATLPITQTNHTKGT